jgi:hypothetical protein
VVAVSLVQFPSGRLRIVADRGDVAARRADVLGSGPVASRAAVPAGAAGRLLVMADRRAPGWRASLDGRPLTATTYDGWAQAFLLPADGGRLDLRFDPGWRPALLWAQAAVLALVLVLLLPSARPHHEHDLAADREGADGVGGPPPVARVPSPVAAGARRRT